MKLLESKDFHLSKNLGNLLQKKPVQKLNSVKKLFQIVNQNPATKSEINHTYRNCVSEENIEIKQTSVTDLFLQNILKEC